MPRRNKQSVWKVHLSKVARYFYHIRMPIGKRRQPMPVVTVCLLLDGNIAHRGISVCHPNDCPSRKAGKIKAASWADKAMFHQGNQVATPTTEVVIDRLSLCCEGSGHTELMPLLKLSEINADFGHYDTKLTGYEQELLGEYVARAVARKEADMKELPEPIKMAIAILRHQTA